MALALRPVTPTTTPGPNTAGGFFTPQEKHMSDTTPVPDDDTKAIEAPEGYVEEPPEHSGYDDDADATEVDLEPTEPWFEEED